MKTQDTINSIKELIQRIKELKKSKTLNYKLSYVFPYTYLLITMKDFQEDSFDENEELFSNKLNITINSLREIGNKSLIIFEYLSTKEFNEREVESSGAHWSQYLLFDEMDYKSPKTAVLSFPVIHFFGFKGGQGRSSVLAAFATSLANDGWNVLAIDSDFEAPSLDIILKKESCKIENTLLGIFLNVEDVDPINVYSNNGRIDLLAATTNNEYEIEYSSFVLQASMSPFVIKDLSEKIIQIQEKRKYDIVLIDHRSGISITPLFWKKELNGPVVVFTKLDAQWKKGTDFLKELLKSNPTDSLGVFVSLKPDEEKLADYEKRTQEQRDELGEIVLEITGDDEIQYTYWYLWDHDKEYRGNLLPQPEIWSKNNETTIKGLRGFLKTSEKKESTQNVNKKLSISGSIDSGQLIMTPNIYQLYTDNNDIAFIVGRKGTGKTRLFRELVNKRFAVPILAPEDFYQERNKESLKYIRSSRAISEMLPYIDKFNKRSSNTKMQENFWWSLIYTVLKAEKSNQMEEVHLRNQIKNSIDPSKDYQTKLIEEILSDRKQNLTIAFDGIDTLFPGPEYLTKFIPALYNVILSIIQDNTLKRLKPKVFIRYDLSKIPIIQNFEQIIKDKKIDLIWTYQIFLNYTLSRICEIDFYKNKFKDVVQQIEKNKVEISKGKLDVIDCEEVLALIFHKESIGIGRMQLKFFFQNCFSDSIDLTGNTDQTSTYYPRIVQEFLKKIEIYTNPIDKQTKRISKKAVETSYEKAVSEIYQVSLKQELTNLIVFDEKKKDKNESVVINFIESLAGKSIPFEKEELAGLLKKDLGNKATKIKIEEALDQMKRLGIFNDNHEDKRWRASYLFRTALKMKRGRD